MPGVEEMVVVQYGSQEEEDAASLKLEEGMILADFALSVSHTSQYLHSKLQRVGSIPSAVALTSWKWLLWSPWLFIYTPVLSGSCFVIRSGKYLESP